MIVEEVGIRIYSRQYCEELFSSRWKEVSTILPWMLVAGGFSRALEKMYATKLLVGKLLGSHNADIATRSFVVDDRSIELPITVTAAQTGVKIAPGPNKFRLLRPAEARERFKQTCRELGFNWEQVALHLTKVLDHMYAENLLLCEADEENFGAIKSALEDDEAVDLRVRLKAPAAPASTVPAPQPQAQPQEKEPAP